VVGCTGGSTNAALHLPALANEAGIDFDLFDVAEIMKDTPYFVDLRPGGKYVAKDLHEVGGVAVVMKELAKRRPAAPGLPDRQRQDAGRKPGRNPRRGGRPGDLSHRLAHHQDRRRGGLKGNLAPDGAIVKVAGMTEAEQVFTGPARVFECEEDAFEAVKAAPTRKARSSSSATKARQAGPGMREMLATTAALSGQGMGKKVALITDGRFRARRGGSASAMSGPRRRMAGRLRCCATAT
jgi:dihydroxy-acid dehydratase